MYLVGNAVSAAHDVAVPNQCLLPAAPNAFVKSEQIQHCRSPPPPEEIPFHLFSSLLLFLPPPPFHLTPCFVLSL